MNPENEKLKIHFTYCVILLVLILIAVATDRWTAQQKFTEYLSNAATLTSLVLGLVAIFYSFVANDGLSKSLGSIANVANEVKESKSHIADYVDLTKKSVDEAKNNTSAIERVSTQVDVSLNKLSQTLEAVKLQTSALNDTVAALPIRLDLLETKVLDATRSLGEKRTAPPLRTAADTLSHATVKQFLQTSALSVNLLCYACVLAKRQEKNLTLETFCVAIESNLANYYSGYLACMDNLQIINRTLVVGQTRVYNVTMVHDALLETKDYVIEYLDRSYRDKPDIKASWLDKMKKVEALFL